MSYDITLQAPTVVALMGNVINRQARQNGAGFRVRSGAVRAEVLRRLQKTGALPGEG